MRDGVLSVTVVVVAIVASAVVAAAAAAAAGQGVTEGKLRPPASTQRCVLVVVVVEFLVPVRPRNSLNMMMQAGGG